MHVGVPSLSGGSGGPTAYHSNYDNFHYYSKFVDPSFKMGGAVAQLFGLVALRQANAAVIPYDVPRYAKDLKGHFEQAVKNVKTIDSNFSEFDQVNAALSKLEQVRPPTKKLWKKDYPAKICQQKRFKKSIPD